MISTVVYKKYFYARNICEFRLHEATYKYYISVTTIQGDPNKVYNFLGRSLNCKQHNLQRWSGHLWL